MEMIPYKGGVPALTALFANESQLYFGAALGLEGHVKRVGSNPVSGDEYGTVSELPGRADRRRGSRLRLSTRSWTIGYFTTQGTPRAVVDKLSKEIADIMQSADMRDQIRKQGYEPRVISTDEWLAKMTAELRRAREIVQAANITPQ